MLILYLYHFMPTLVYIHTQGHATPSVAAEMALKCGAKRLILNHVGSQFLPFNTKKTIYTEDVRSDQELLHEARDALGRPNDVMLARDFVTVKIPSGGYTNEDLNKGFEYEFGEGSLEQKVIMRELSGVGANSSSSSRAEEYVSGYEASSAGSMPYYDSSADPDEGYHSGARNKRALGNRNQARPRRHNVAEMDPADAAVMAEKQGHHPRQHRKTAQSPLKKDFNAEKWAFDDILEDKKQKPRPQVRSRRPSA
jgi:hypothetical protein